MPHEYYITLIVPDKAIKLQYRKRSLLVHPDKNTHENAREAFEELQKAQNEFLDPEKRRLWLKYMEEARAVIFHKAGLKIPKPMRVDDDQVDPEINKDEILEKFPKIGTLIQLEFIRMCQELEYRDRIRLKNEKGRELDKNEAEVEEAKKKREFEKEWEKTREKRIGSWKTFQEKGVKKKKKKDKPLGSLPFKK
ncbi:hypothetical protein BC833DRAFT_608956 [Globomyces pollinis-pini]|nr:hypothetical protein BC833DRAFT_608956 [Globomyces pollinis-pini]